MTGHSPLFRKKMVAFRPSQYRRPQLTQQPRLDADTVKASANWEVFYTSQLGPLKGRGPWRDALCPFHPDRHPSLRVNVETGQYKCMACGVSGDGLTLLQNRDGMTFAVALKTLRDFQ